MCWYNIRPARLIQRPTLEWPRPVCVCFHLLQYLLQNYMPDAVQSMLNNEVTEPARIYHKEKIFIQTTSYWHIGDKLAVCLRDIRTSIQTKNSLHSTFRRSSFVNYKFWPLIRISYAEIDSRIKQTNKHFELPRCRCVSAKRTPESLTWSGNLIWVHTVVFTCSCKNFFQTAYHTRPPVLAKW